METHRLVELGLASGLADDAMAGAWACSLCSSPEVDVDDTARGAAVEEFTDVPPPPTSRGDMVVVTVACPREASRETASNTRACRTASTRMPRESKNSTNSA